jgi:hypothetical protein
MHITKIKKLKKKKARPHDLVFKLFKTAYSTVTDFAKFLG